MTDAGKWGVGIALGAAFGVGVGLFLRRAGGGGLSGSLDARVGSLEGRVDSLDERLTGGLRMISSFGSRLELMENRGPQVQYVVQQVPQRAPPAPPRRVADEPARAAPLLDDSVDPAVRRFQMIEYD